MNNDLISRSALKEAFRKDIMGGLNWKSIIDGAPTVEPEKVLVANVTFDEDKLKEIVHTEVIEKIKSSELVVKTEERPQGNWLITDAWPHQVYCSKCYETYAQADWLVWKDGSLPRAFCPNCGAKMQEGDEGNERIRI